MTDRAPAPAPIPGAGIREVTFSRGATINTGNFNNLKLDLSATMQVQPGETADQAYERLRAWVSDKLRAEAARLTNGSAR